MAFPWLLACTVNTAGIRFAFVTFLSLPTGLATAKENKSKGNY